ncbi:MAG: RibD family protein [Synechococcus sp.]
MTATRPLVRLVLAVSLDGRLAPPEGGAAQIGGPGDRRALEEALAWADGCLIGAETLRRHGTTCLLHQPDLLAQRAEAGRPPQPVAVAVSRAAAFPPELPFFHQPLRRWWLDPSAGSAAPEAWAELAPGAAGGGFERALRAPGWPEALQQLAAVGLRRLVLLGGARLVGSLAAAGCLDELQLTHCPRLLGGPHLWLPPETGVAEALAGHWCLKEQRRLEGEELLVLYGRDPSPR